MSTYKDNLTDLPKLCYNAPELQTLHLLNIIREFTFLNSFTQQSYLSLFIFIPLTKDGVKHEKNDSISFIVIDHLELSSIWSISIFFNLPVVWLVLSLFS